MWVVLSWGSFMPFGKFRVQVVRYFDPVCGKLVDIVFFRFSGLLDLSNALFFWVAFVLVDFFGLNQLFLATLFIWVVSRLQCNICGYGYIMGRS
jgi:hypothetical protein